MRKGPKSTAKRWIGSETKSKERRTRPKLREGEWKTHTERPWHRQPTPWKEKEKPGMNDTSNSVLTQQQEWKNPGRRLGGKRQDQRGQVYRDKGNHSKAESRRRCRPRGEGYEMAQDHPHSRRSNPDLHRRGHRGGHDGADMRMDDLLQLHRPLPMRASRSDCQRQSNAHPMLALV